jgi:hypothetical protein
MFCANLVTTIEAFAEVQYERIKMNLLNPCHILVSSALLSQRVRQRLFKTILIM